MGADLDLPSSVQTASQVKADVLVIGSGPSGAVTATLWAEAGYSVLMVEEGSHLSLESTPHFSRDEILKKYRNAGIEVAVGPVKLAFVEGCCVGGGSEINRGLYHRTPDYILDRWSREFQVDSFTPDALRPHFEACEQTARVEYLPLKSSGISSRLAAGAEALGWRCSEAPRLFQYSGSSGKGRKQSMSVTFVPRFLRAGGRLLANTRVNRLVRRAGNWYASAFHNDGVSPVREIELLAKKVFVACGAVQTPLLLRRSGVTHNVGNNLRFHPMLKLVARFETEVNFLDDPDPVHQIREFEPRLGMGCSVSNRTMLGLALANHPNHFQIVKEDWKRLGIYYLQISGGMASVRSLPFFRDPLIKIKYAQEDLRDLADGLKRLAEALFAAGAERIYPAVAGYPQLKSLDDVKALPDVFNGSDGSLTSVHVFSSCPMGEDKRRSAADSFGRVHGADGLYIVDASLLCGPTSVNPQGTVMALAHRNAVELLSRRTG